MVNLRYIPLIVLMVLVSLSAGCAMNPLQSSRAPVEEPEQMPAPPPRPAQRIDQAPVQESAPVPSPETPPNKKESVELQEEKNALEKSGSAVVALLDDSDQNAAAGRQEQAVASLERALRIEPKNPLLWHKLSRLRLEEKNWKQALALAKKSNVLAPGNKALEAENWRIIAQSLAALDDESGAAKAREMVRQLEN